MKPLMKKTSLGLLACLILATGLLKAQQAADNTTEKRQSFKHAFNMCPGGIALGIFSVNYEQLIKPNHGLMVRFDYEAIPRTYSDADIESQGFAGIVNYRYHLKGEMNSLFLGAYGRFRVYKGEGNLEGSGFDFSIPETTLGLNAGKRWAWNSGFTMTFALGYGISFQDRKVDNSTPAIESAIDQFEKGYDFIDPFLGEFSIGYTF